MKIKAYTCYSDSNKTRYYTNFEVVDSIPEVGEVVFDDSLVRKTVDRIDKVWIDGEQPNDDVYEYNYYKIHLKVENCDLTTDEWVEDEDEEVLLFAVKIESED